MTNFLPWAQPYTAEEADRLLKAAPEHLAGEIAALISAVNQAHEDRKHYGVATGVWYHVSPHLISPGTTLLPGGLDPQKPTSGEFYSRDGFGDDTGTLAHMGAIRAQFVWLTISEEDAQFWADTLSASHTYEVEPLTEPQPWNGTGVDGWVTTAAKVIRKL